MELIGRRDGEESPLEVTRQGGLYRVVIGDRLYEVDVEPLGETGRSLIVAGEQHEVSVSSLGRGLYRVGSSRGVQEVEIFDPLTRLARQAARGGGADGSQRTLAYMPGRVVALLVEPGESVEAGQGVLVLEAMKMENEIAAERAGVVDSFFVEDGQAVETGDPLFEIS